MDVTGAGGAGGAWRSALLSSTVASRWCSGPILARSLPYVASAPAVNGELSPTVARKMRSASAMCLAASACLPNFSWALPTEVWALAIMDESTT